VDLFHFLISLAQVIGMSADDVFAAYVKKNEVNFKRQDSGYAQKDESDSRHI
jgi:dimeric dUTPase (all-alpha-NTP-PPase superfamily)